MKKLMVLFFVLGVQINAFSQLHPYQWRLGISSGYASYYGDLSPFTISTIKDYENFARLYDYNKNYIPDFSYAVSLEGRLSPSMGLLFSTGKFTISMSDRYMDKQNVLQLEAPNFERALNFKTDIRDFGLGLVFRTDNGKIINKNAFMAPFFIFGGGWANFKVFGDLYDEKGDPYNYLSNESINDGIFETRVDKLNTEIPGGYADNAFYGTMGVGLRFRLAKQMELFVQSDFKYTATDYLDDVSGQYRMQYESPEQFYAARPGYSTIDWENPYRGNRNGRNDWFVYHSIGIKISFKSNKTAFRASRVSPGILKKVEDDIVEKQAEVMPAFPEALSPMDKEPVTANNYITFIQMNPASNRDSSYYSFKMLESDVSIIRLENQLTENENWLGSLSFRLDSLDNLREEFLALPSEKEDNNPKIAMVQSAMDEVRTQLVIAQQDGKEIEQDLTNARQNKKLYRTAYELSLINSSKKDSIGFFNEILELPEAVKKALTNTGAFYSVKEDTANTSFFSSPGLLAVGSTDSTGDIFSPAVPLDLQKHQNQMDRLRSDLMHERARSYYLLQHLNTYAGNPSLPSSDQRLSDNEEFQHPSLRRNNARPLLYYSYPSNTDYPMANRPERIIEDSGYPLPLTVPGNNNRGEFFPENSESRFSGPGRPAPKNSSPREPFPAIENKRIIPGPREISAGFSDLKKVKISSYFPEITKRANLNIADTPLERNRDAVDTVYLENRAPHSLLNNREEIYFETNQVEPGNQELKKLLPIATSLKNNPDWRISIAGFADNTGNLRYNLDLINKRISHVKSFFVEDNGISPERIVILPGGLIIRGSGQEHNPMDRKVEVWIQEND
jgi:outer membrane protein OmpA-like peptidoglycan-associated protein